MFRAEKKEKKEKEKEVAREELNNEKKKREIMRAKLIMPPDVNHYVSPSTSHSISLSSTSEILATVSQPRGTCEIDSRLDIFLKCEHKNRAVHAC